MGMQKIEYLIKHNAFVQKAYVVVMSAGFRFIGLFIKKNPHQVFFQSLIGRNYGDSPKIIFDAMRSDPDFKDFKYVWAFVDPDKFSVPDNTEKVGLNSLKYFTKAIQSGVWVCNVNIERGLLFKPRKTVFLNTGHGGQFKVDGNAQKNRNDYDYSDVDMFCSFSNGKSILKIVISLSVISVIAYVIISNLEVARVTVSRFIIDENFDNGRIVRYSAILDSLRSNFLFGAGTGSVNEIIGGGGHNIYLTVLLENGVIGALFFIAVLIMQIKTTISVAFRLSKLPDSSNYIALVSFSLFLQVFFITYGMSGNPLYDNYILYYYMIGVLINENFHYRLRQTALGNSNLSLSV